MEASFNLKINCEPNTFHRKFPLKVVGRTQRVCDDSQHSQYLIKFCNIICLDQTTFKKSIQSLCLQV